MEVARAFSPRPVKVHSMVSVESPHPRALSTPQLVDLKERILRELGVEDAASS